MLKMLLKKPDIVKRLNADSPRNYFSVILKKHVSMCMEAFFSTWKFQHGGNLQPFEKYI